MIVWMEGVRGLHEMQRSFDPSLSWPHVVYLALAGILGYLARTAHRWIVLWLNRNKPVAEIHETEARTHEITIRSHSAAGDTVIKFMDRLDEAQEKIDAKNAELTEVIAERDVFKGLAARQRIELDLADKQMKRIKGLMDAHGIKLSELDERR